MWNVSTGWTFLFVCLANQNLPIEFVAPVSRGGGGGPRAPGPDNCARFGILRWPGVSDAGFGFLCAFIPPAPATVAFVCFR